FLAPGGKRLAREKSWNTQRPAHHLAALEGQILLRAALITHDDIELGAKRLIEQLWNEMTAGAAAGRRTLGCFLGLAHIFDALVRRSRAHVKQPRGIF